MGTDGNRRERRQPGQRGPTEGGLEGRVHEFICCPDGNGKMLHGDLLQDTYIHVTLKFNLLKHTY